MVTSDSDCRIVNSNSILRMHLSAHTHTLFIISHNDTTCYTILITTTYPMFNKSRTSPFYPISLTQSLPIACTRRMTPCRCSTSSQAILLMLSLSHIIQDKGEKYSNSCVCGVRQEDYHEKDQVKYDRER